MPKPPRHEFLCPVCTSIGLKHRGIPQTLDFTAKNNPDESLHRGLSSRATPAAQGYKDSNLEMTESESVALPFGDSPMSCYLKYYTRSISNLQYPNSNFFKFFYFSILLFFYFPTSLFPPKKEEPRSSCRPQPPRSCPAPLTPQTSVPHRKAPATRPCPRSSPTRRWEPAAPPWRS